MQEKTMKIYSIPISIWNNPKYQYDLFMGLDNLLSLQQESLCNKKDLYYSAYVIYNESYINFHFGKN